MPREAQGRLWRLARGLRSFADGFKPARVHGEVAISMGAMLSSAELEMAFANPQKLTYDQIDEMRWDETVFACENALFRTCLRTPWSIEPPDDDPEDERHMAADVDWMLRLMRGTLRKKLGEIAGVAYRYGHSETERVLVDGDGRPAVVVHPEFGQRQVIYELKTRDPTTFTYKLDAHGNIAKKGLIQTVGTEERYLDPADFILYAWAPEFNNPYGNTAYRPIYRPWFCKKWNIKFLNLYLERKSGGIFVLKLKPAYNPDQDKTRAEDVLKSIQNDTELLIPEEKFELEIKEPSGEGARAFTDAIKMQNFFMAAGLLAPEHLGFTETEGGAYSKAVAQQDLWMGVVDDVRADIEEAIVGECVIKPYIDMNYPNVTKYPKFKFAPLVEDDKWALLEKIIDAVRQGPPGMALLDWTEEDQDWLRERYGLPELPEDFRTEGKTTSTGNGGASQEGGGEEGTAGEGAESAEAPQFSSFPRRIFADRSFPRSLTRYERHVDFAGIRDRSDDLEASTVEKITTTIDGALTDWLDHAEKIVKLGNTAKGRHAVRRLRLKGESEIKQAIRAALIMSHLFGKKDVLDEARRATGQKFAQPVEFADASSLHMIPREAVKFLRGLKIGADAMAIIGETAFDITGVVRHDVLEKARGILLRALEHGDHARARRELREGLKAYVSQQGPYGGQVVKDAVLAPHRIETIVRTNLATAYNRGRDTQMADPDVDHVIAAYQVSAILDDNTTDYCAAMDSNVFDKDECPDFPAHPRCRTIRVPVFVGETYTKTTQGDVRDAYRKASVEDRKVKWREQPVDPDKIVRAEGFGR